MKKAIFLLVLLGNIWLWRIFFSSPLVAILLLTVTSVLFFYLHGHAVLKIIFWILFSALLAVQIGTTTSMSLTSLSNDEIRIRDMRLREYPLVSIHLGTKAIWIPIAHWFEGRAESIAFFRMMRNFSEAIDPNVYFFANHPRERIGTVEFEKFPYIFLPFFLYGIFCLAKKDRKIIFCSFIIPVIAISFMGPSNKFGTIALFPFIVVVAAMGLYSFFEFLTKKYKISKMKFVAAGMGVFLLVLAQTLAYALY